MTKGQFLPLRTSQPGQGICGSVGGFLSDSKVEGDLTGWLGLFLVPEEE